MKVLSAVLLTLLTACAATVPEEKPAAKSAAPAVASAPAVAAKPARVADYMTAQENEIRALTTNPAFGLKRRKNILIVTLTGNAVFAQNSYRMEAPAADFLKRLASVVADYDKTRIGIFAYTKNTGKASTNQQLSDRRADAASAVLENAAKIADVRIWAEGKGVSDVNRVEIVLTPTFR